MFRRKSIIKDWIISYTIIFILPLIAVFVNYHYSVKTIRQEIVKAHELILDNLKDNVDLLMKDQQETFFYFSKNEKLKRMIYSQTMDVEFYQEAWTFLRELEMYSTGDPYIDYWLYMEDKDYVICNDGGDTSKNKHSAMKLISCRVPSYEEWKQFLSGEYSDTYFFYEGLYKAIDKPVLVYANSYDGTANVFVAASVRTIEALTKTLPEGAFLTISIDNGRENQAERLIAVGAHGLMLLPESVDASQLTGGQRTFEVADYMGMSAVSSNSEIVYSLLMPQESFWYEIRNIRNVHLICLLVTLLLGIGFGIILLKKNFQPVSSLLNVIGGGNKESSEFDQFKMAFDVMRQENDSMKKTMQSQKQKLIGSYLLSLLKGRAQKVSSREQEFGLQLSLDKGAFALVGFHIPATEGKSIEHDELDFFIVDNVMSELMEKENFYRIEDGRFLFYFFCIDQEKIGEWEEKSVQNTKFLCEFVEEKFSMNILAVISTVEHDISQIKYMYQNVMEAFEYKSIIGGNGMICTSEISSSDEYKQNHDCQIMLMRAVENGDEEEVLKVAQKLFVDAEKMPLLVLRLRVLEAFQTVNDGYNTYISEVEKRMQFLGWMDALLKAEDVLSIKKQFNNMVVFACTAVKYQREAESRRLVKSIKEYVEENYTNCNLNITTIAEEITRNSRYVSKIFKEETGEGINDYINALRMKRAKELLLMRKYTIEEVGEMVGYASTRTFRRSFVKVVGVTPSDFMEKN